MQNYSVGIYILYRRVRFIDINIVFLWIKKVIWVHIVQAFGREERLVAMVLIFFRCGQIVCMPSTSEGSSVKMIITYGCPYTHQVQREPVFVVFLVAPSQFVSLPSVLKSLFFCPTSNVYSTHVILNISF